MNRKHGFKGTRVYRAWCNMRYRCDRKTYANITVCERWLKFENFLEDMGRPTAGLTLERKDNTKGYYKENCCWATPLEQANNTSRSIKVSHEGVTLTIAQWAKRLGIPYTTLRNRYKGKARTDPKLLFRQVRAYNADNR